MGRGDEQDRKDAPDRQAGSWPGMLKQTASDFGEDGGTRLAAALSYYTIFSLPPLLILLLLILGAVLDPAQVRGLLEGQVGDLLGPAGSQQVATMMEQADQPDLSRGLVAVLGVGALLFGAVGAFVELQNALNRIWEVAPDPERGGIRNFISQRLMSFGMLLTLAFLLLVSLVVSALLVAFGDAIGDLLPGALSGVVLQVINLAVTLAVIALLFALLFRFVPDANIAWKDVWVGAIFTAVLFLAGKFGLGLYLGRSDPGSAFGAAGALALLLVWIYYSAIIVFLGAEFTQVWARHRGSGIEPADGAVRLVVHKDVEGRGGTHSRHAGGQASSDDRPDGARRQDESDAAGRDAESGSADRRAASPRTDDQGRTPRLAQDDEGRGI